ETFVVRAKRLINFFMAPKQNERLEEAQKTLKISDNNVIRKTSTYFHVKMDVPTHWNSSFLAWERLLLIKDTIDIVITTLTNLMRDLVDILGPFFETTEELGGSKYITIFYILLSILGLMRNLTSSTSYTNDELSEVNFETDDLAFDNNIGFIDAEKEEDEGPKKRKININTPTNIKNMKHKIKNALYSALLHYWDLSD
ncbi:2350_t:CDS:2, partial [Gigaspora margarita]